jgi:hypothetical protein
MRLRFSRLGPAPAWPTTPVCCQSVIFTWLFDGIVYELNQADHGTVCCVSYCKWDTAVLEKSSLANHTDRIGAGGAPRKAGVRRAVRLELITARGRGLGRRGGTGHRQERAGGRSTHGVQRAVVLDSSYS